MRAAAPGKVVLSGAYAVLEGAPALVAAVGRYVIADASREAELVTAEVGAAIECGDLQRAPWFDASALRAIDQEDRTRKLGLGSSAAILVASLAAGSRRLEDDAFRARILPVALRAHRAAQAGGSGVDVAASVHGGIIACKLRDDGALDIASHALPRGTTVEVFSSPTAASTASMLGRVRHFAALSPADYRLDLDRCAAGAHRALAARSTAELVDSLHAQLLALAELGQHAGVPIVTPSMAPISKIAREQGGVFLPAGAGGGDVAIYVGPEPSSAAFRAAAHESFVELHVEVGARGVHRLD